MVRDPKEVGEEGRASGPGATVKCRSPRWGIAA